MPQMCLSRLREALRHRLAHPLALAHAASRRRRATARARLSARVSRARRRIAVRSLLRPRGRLRRSRAGQPARRSTASSSSSARSCGQRVKLDDRPPPEPLLVLLGRVRHQAGELEPVKPALHARAMRLHEPARPPASSPRLGMFRQPMIGASPITSCATEQPNRAEPPRPAHFSPLPRRHR